MKNKLHSVVVPVYRSRDSLVKLVERVFSVLQNEKIKFELILVDDGSPDGSFEEIKRLAKLHHEIRGYQLSRNYGQQVALSIGLQRASGDYIAIIDDDLQDPPELLPEFFKALYEGADVAYGIRTNRKEGLIKRFLYSAFYRLLSTLSHISIPRDAGDFCAMKRRAVNAMLELKSARPFLRGNRSWIGFRQIGIPYERSARYEGQPGYTLLKYLQFAISGILSFSYIPLRAITYFGFLVALFSSLFALCNIIGRLLNWFDVPGYTSLITFLVFFGSIQLISLGIVGEYVARLLDEAKGWPVAFVSAATTDEDL